MKKYLIALIALALTAGACKKENPYVDPVPPAPPLTANNVAFIWNNDVYFMSNIRGSATRITNTGTVKTMVRVSHDHTKFAYKNANGTIEIVDASGNITATLTQFTYVDDFIWSADDATLYILSTNQIQYYGPSMGLPAITYPGVPITAQKYVKSLSVSAANDLAYVIYYEDTWAGFGSVLVIKPHDGSPTLTRTINDPFRMMSYVRFSIHETDLVLGYYGFGSGNSNLIRLEMFTNLSMTPIRTLESSEEYVCPIYRSDLHVFTCGYMSSNSPDLAVTMYDLNNIPGERVALNAYTGDGTELCGYFCLRA